MQLLVQACRNIIPYLNFTISNESPGFHPTMPSAIAAFETAVKRVEAAPDGWLGYYAGPGAAFWVQDKPPYHELIDDVRPATTMEKYFFSKHGRIGDNASLWIHDDDALSLIIRRSIEERDKR